MMMQEIVIKIPEEIWERVKDNYVPLGISKYLKNGTVLPKGHGRLIDADKLEPRDISPEAWYSPMWGFELVDIEDAPTIIEAERSEE